jgi:hypothetical protein
MPRLPSGGRGPGGGRTGEAELIEMAGTPLPRRRVGKPCAANHASDEMRLWRN